MKTKSLYHLLLVWKPKINLDGILGKNTSNRLINLMQKFVKLVIETNSNIHELKPIIKP